MVSDFIQKHVAIFRIVILLMMIFGILSTSAIANDIIERNNRYDYAIYDGKLIYQSVEAIKSELNTNKVARKKRFKVVIDAGHGGHDTGAVGSSSKEKDLTLSMALKLEKYINKNLPEVDVLLTRNTDVFIPLFRRIQYANDEKADLFISLHCNYISNSKTRGTETFVMGLHRATENLEGIHR